MDFYWISIAIIWLWLDYLLRAILKLLKKYDILNESIGIKDLTDGLL